jgi:tetratricopeptide (TPR) repeat protein
MSLQFARNAALLLMIVTSTVSAAVLSDGLQKGKNYYFAGELKKGISQFELTIEKNPNDPEPYLWLGKSYGLLADTKAPIFSTRARLKARRYLAKAVQLAPDCVECRRELFDFLEHPGIGSRLPLDAILTRASPQTELLSGISDSSALCRAVPSFRSAFRPSNPRVACRAPHPSYFPSPLFR